MLNHQYTKVDIPIPSTESGSHDDGRYAKLKIVSTYLSRQSIGTTGGRDAVNTRLITAAVRRVVGIGRYGR